MTAFELPPDALLPFGDFVTASRAPGALDAPGLQRVVQHAVKRLQRGAV